MTGETRPACSPAAEVSLCRVLPSVAGLSRGPPSAHVASGRVMTAAHSQVGESPLCPNEVCEAHLTAVGKAACGLPGALPLWCPVPMP